MVMVVGVSGGGRDVWVVMLCDSPLFCLLVA